MKQNPRSRLLAWLLTVCMVVSLVPGMAITAGASTVTEVTTSTAQTLFSSDGIRAGSYQLKNHITLNAATKVSTGEVTIDLNGYTLSLAQGATDPHVILLDGGKLTIQDSSGNHTGKILCDKPSGKAIYCNQGGATLEIFGGTFEGTDNGIDVSTMYTNVTIHDGIFIGNNFYGLSNMGTTVINGGKFTGSQRGAVKNILNTTTVHAGLFKADGKSSQEEILPGVTLGSGTVFQAASSGGGWYEVVPRVVVTEKTVRDPAELQSALADSNITTINLGQDITLTSGLSITRNITINGGGYSLNRDSSFTGTLLNVSGTVALNQVNVDGKNITASGPLLLVEGGSVTLGNASSLKNGINTEESGGDGAGGAVNISNNGTFTMSSGSSITNCQYRYGGAVLVGNSTDSASVNNKFVMDGGTISGCSASGADTGKGGGGVYVWYGTADLNGGSFSSNTAVSAHGTDVYAYGAAAAVELSGSVSADIYKETSAKLYITGTLSGTTTVDLISKDAGTVVAEGKGYTVTAADLGKLSVTGETLELNSSNQAVIQSKSVPIDSADALQNAINNATDGQTIQLDGPISGSVTIPNGKNIILDLKGQTLTGTADQNAISVIAGGKLEVTDSSSAKNGMIVSSKSGISNAGDLTITAGTVQGNANGIHQSGLGKAIINGGTIIGTGCTVYNEGTSTGNKINGGLLKHTGTAGGSVLGGKNSTSSWTIQNDGSVTMYSANGVTVLTGPGGSSEGEANIAVTNWNQLLIWKTDNSGNFKVIKGYSGDASAINSAISASAENPVHVILSGNVTGNLQIPAAKSVILDLNGHSITNTAGTAISNAGTLKIINSSTTAGNITGYAVGIANTGSLEIKGDSPTDIVITSTGTHECISNVKPATKLDINNATIRTTVAGKAAICDAAENSVNTIGANTVLEAAGGYVLAGYGETGKAGTYTIAPGAQMKNTVNNRWVLTNNGANGGDYVAVSNWGAIQFNSAGSGSAYTATVSDKITSATPASAQEFLSALSNPDISSITLGADITLTSGQTVNRPVTIDGNGKTIHRGSYTGTLFTVTAGGVLNLRNITVDGGAVWTTNDSAATSVTTGVTPAVINNVGKGGIVASATENGGGQLIFVNGGTLNLGASTVLQNNDRRPAGTTVHYAPISDEGSAVYVKGGTLIMDPTAVIQNNRVADSDKSSRNGDGAALSIEQCSSATISGTITGNYSGRMGGAVRVFHGNNTKNITVQDATVQNNYTGNSGYCAVMLGVSATVSGTVIIDGNYLADGSKANLSANGTGVLTKGASELTASSRISVKPYDVFIQNGIVMKNAEEMDTSLFAVDSGALTPVFDSGNIKLGSAAASEMQNKITSAANGETVTLTLDSDITLPQPLTIPEGKKVILDLNGKTLTGAILSSGDLTILDSSASGGGKIDSTSFTAAVESAGANAKLTVEVGVHIQSKRHALRIEGGTAVINGGVFQALGRAGDADTVHALNAGGTIATTVTINGGEFRGIGYDGNAETADSGTAVNAQNNATVTIHGGKFSHGQNNTLQKSGTGVIHVQGGQFDRDPTAYTDSGYSAKKIPGTSAWYSVLSDTVIAAADSFIADYLSVSGATVTSATSANYIGIISGEAAWNTLSDEVKQLIDGILADAGGVPYADLLRDAKALKVTIDAENLSDAKNTATASINSTAAAKKAEIDALPYLNATRKAELKAEVDAAVTAAIANINAATTPAEAGTAMSDGISAIQAIVAAAVHENTKMGELAHLLLIMPRQLTFTFDTNGGTLIPTARISAGTTLDLSQYSTAREGYEFTGWFLDADLNEAVTSLKPTKNMTVYAGWKKLVETTPENPIVNPFADIYESDWYYDAVMYVYQKDLMGFTDGNKFSPALNMTRGMLVTILYRLEGEPAVFGAPTFKDVPDGQWYTRAVIWAAANGIAEGMDNGKYEAETPITREQLVTMLWRYAKYKGLDVSRTPPVDLSGYADEETIRDYASPAMKWAVAEGIIGGYDGYLTPGDHANRGQAAAILYRYCRLLGR